MNKKLNYWLVGAYWAGTDKKENFYLKGAWEMGYDDNDQPKFSSLRDSINIGDRIALKSRDGRGASTITIHAIGIVKLVEDKKVYIDWKLTDLNRKVYSKGKFSTIHKLDSKYENWINEIFCI